MVQITQRKKDYRARLEKYLAEYKNVLIITADNVGSRQLQKVRIALRGTAVLLFGKNTIMRKVIREAAESDPRVKALNDYIYGNIGFVFTNGDLAQVRNILTQEKIPAAARAGGIAPVDYFLNPGPTGLDPGQTAFFQALNIGTKIVKGAIEIINEVHICKKGEKVTASGVALLGKLNIKPFFFGIDVKYVYEDGCVFSSSILDLTDADLLAKFGRAVNKLTSVSLAIGYPTLSTVPHSFARAFKKALALSIATDFTFPAAQKYKDYLADPAAYAAKHGIVAAAAAPAAAAPAAAGKPAPAVKAPEPEPEEEAPADFNLFD